MKSLLLGLAMAAMATSADAATVLFNFDAHTGVLGNAQTYTSGAYTITASGFRSDGGLATALFGKNAGGDENGVGLNDDPSGEHEITGTNFIQIDVSKLTGTGPYSFVMGSTVGEGWRVFGSNVSDFFSGSPLLTGSDEGVSHALTGGFKFYDFQSTSGNVLLGSFTAAVPEPATWIMMILGFGSVGLLLRSKRGQLATA